MIIQLFSRFRSSSLLVQGIARLDTGTLVEFAGLFDSAEEKKLFHGAPIRGHLSTNVLRNAELVSYSP